MPSTANLSMSGGTLSMTWTPDESAPTPRSYPASSSVEGSFISGDFNTDRTDEFNVALSAAKSSGSGLVFYSGNHRILGDLVIPEGVALVGPVRAAGQLVHLGVGAADYEQKPGVLRLSPTATIRVGTSGYFGDSVVIRDGLNLPFDGVSSALAGIAAFSGTAVTIAGNDARVSNVLCIGFNCAVDSNGYSRPRLTNIQGDCTSGIRIAACTDVPYIEKCHFWPFTTANYSWTASDTTQRILVRSGVAYELRNTVDWGKLTNCFSYGYFRGFRLADVQSSTLLGCASDGPVSNGGPVQQGAIGLLIEGAAFDNQIIGGTFHAASQGMFFGGNAGTYNEAIGCNTVACTIGANVRDGDVSINGGLDRVAQIGLQVQSMGSRVNGFRTMRQVNTPINASNPANVKVTVN